MLRFFARWLGAPQREARPPPPAAPPADDAQALLAPASAALAAGRTSAARQALEALIERHPQLAEAHLMLGTLDHQQKRYADARDSYLLAACHRAHWPEPHVQLGLLALEEERNHDAIDALTRALALGATSARSYAVLGAAYLKAGDIEQAVAWLRKALMVEPNHAPAHSNLGYALFMHLEDYEKGAWHIQRALELSPNDHAVLCNLMMALQHDGRSGEALEVANRVLAADPGIVEARVNRALIHLKYGDFASGWADYEARRSLPGEDLGADMPWPDWDGTPLEGRSILVYGEQGMGDEIMFASCIPEVLARARHCTIACRSKLERLFRRSFPDARVIVLDTWREDHELQSRPPDFRAPVGSLPRFLRGSLEAFPRHAGYLRANPERVAAWEERLRALPGRLKVGVSWRGGLATTRRNVRSIPLAQWQALLRVAGVDFVSLQYSDPEHEIERLAREQDIVVHAWPEAIDDYDETAALVDALDLVISVQTAVVHLSGALGKAAWALIPHVPEWRYGAAGDSMPWYPAVRLIRQERAGDWEAVLRQVGGELEARVASAVD